MSVTDTSQKEGVLLDKLEEGDSVMADKGFNIRDLLTRKKVALNIPPLCKGTFPIKGANGVGVEEGLLGQSKKTTTTTTKTDITASITCCS